MFDLRRPAEAHVCQRFAMKVPDLQDHIVGPYHALRIDVAALVRYCPRRSSSRRSRSAT
jgi:hypothetical protein